ncbi:MAG: hypothetical protein OEV68_10220 [candidate division Zixibacteria bacterium]|nr:hypothetical protein [candidate division Zixibacteria bacterium]
MGNGASQFDYCLYGWRFNVECRIPDKSVLFDVCSITDSYCYAARLGSSVTIVLLSKRDLEDRVVADYYRNRLRSVIDGSIEFTCTPFVYPMPTRLRDPYQRNMIGTMRGINDSLFYFGFSDSIVDGINYGLWRAFEDYNAGSFLRNNFRKHALIEIANFLKNVFHYFGKKELFAEMILKNRLLTDCFIGLTSTSFSEDLAESIGRITTGWRHRSDAKTTAPLSGRIRPSTGGGFTAIDSPFDSAQGDTVKS